MLTRKFDSIKSVKFHVFCFIVAESYSKTIVSTYEKVYLAVLKTKKIGKTHQPKEFCDAIDVVTNSLRWSTFSIVGHSLGARIAFVYGAKNPIKIEKIVFVNY